MFIIGITGGIGSGKSTVAEFCRQAGFTVLDADSISREVTMSGGAALPEIIEIFGTSVLNSKGALDRERMARSVFSDKRRLDQLSAIIHKHVIEQIMDRTEKLKKSKEKAIFLDVPIPVKHGFLDISDQIWVVWAEDDVRIKRLRARGMSDDEARRRMQMQMTNEEYLRLADRQIDNSSDLDALREQVLILMQQELASRGIRFSQLEDSDSKMDDFENSGDDSEIKADEPEQNIGVKVDENEAE